MSDQGTYQVEMHCINCEKGVSVDIPRGVRVADFAGECPRCGCVEVLSRIAKMKPLPNRFDPNQHEQSVLDLSPKVAAERGGRLFRSPLLLHIRRS